MKFSGALRARLRGDKIEWCSFERERRIKVCVDERTCREPGRRSLALPGETVRRPANHFWRGRDRSDQFQIARAQGRQPRPGQVQWLRNQQRQRARATQRRRCIPMGSGLGRRAPAAAPRAPARMTIRMTSVCNSLLVFTPSGQAGSHIWRGWRREHYLGKRLRRRTRLLSQMLSHAEARRWSRREEGGRSSRKNEYGFCFDRRPLNS